MNPGGKTSWSSLLLTFKTDFFFLIEVQLIYNINFGFNMVNFGGHTNFFEELCTELKDGRSSVD